MKNSLGDNLELEDPQTLAQVLGKTATADDVRDLLERANPLQGQDGPIACKVTGPIQRRMNSVLFIAEHGMSPTPLLIKVCTGFDGDTALEAQRQFDALDRVGKAMGLDSRFTVPRPFPLSIESGCVVMQWVDGVSLLDLMRDWKTSPARLSSVMNLAGQWLRSFHAAGFEGLGNIDTENLQVSIPEIFHDSGARFSEFAANPLVTKALSFLASHADPVARWPVSRSWHHGDFKPENLLLSGDRMFGIDLDVIHKAECLRDLANFLFELDFGLLHPLAWRLRFFHQRLRDSFIEGYAERNGSQLGVSLESAKTHLCLKWLLLHRIVRGWAEAEASPNTGLRSRYVRHCFHRLLSSALMLESPTAVE